MTVYRPRQLTNVYRGKAMMLKVKVVPGASDSRIVGWLGDELKIRISAPPEKGKANGAVLKLLANELRVHESALSIVSGHTSQRKVIDIQGVTLKEVQELIAACKT